MAKADDRTVVADAEARATVNNSDELPTKAGDQPNEDRAAPGDDASETEHEAPFATSGPALSARGSQSRRPVEFQASHALKFGLEVVSHDASTTPPRVAAVLCLFCKHFGREPKAGAKRRATTNFKYFKGVFRTDQYLQHHRLQHPTKWAEYDAASVREKQTFFPRYMMPDGGEEAATKLTTKKPRPGASDATAAAGDANGIERGAVVDQEPTQMDDKASQFEIPTRIVELVLGGTRWEPRSFAPCEQTQASPNSSNMLIAGPQRADVKTTDVSVYRGTLPDRLSFDMAVDLLATGLSTDQVARALRAIAKYVPNGATLASTWTDLVVNYAQVTTLGSLTLLSSLLSSCWAFSIGFHQLGGSPDDVDVRVRFHCTKLNDLHLCRLGVDETKETLERFLEVLCPGCKRNLIGVSVAGDLVTSSKLIPAIQWLLANVSTRDTVRVTWSGNALLRRAFFRLFQELQGGVFAKTFYDLKTYVKSQARLIQEIGHEAQPQLVPSHPAHESLGEIVATARWLTEKRVRIRKFFEEESEPTSSRPSESWWLCLAIFDWIAAPTAQAMWKISTQLSGLASLEQFMVIQELDEQISSAFRIRGVGNGADHPVSANTVEYHSSEQSCTATKTGVLEYIVDLGTFVNSLLKGFGHDEMDATLASLGTSIATFVETLRIGVRHGHEYSNAFEVAAHAASTAALPPVLLQDFVKLNGKEFSAFLSQYRQQLCTRFSEEDLDTMEQEHVALKRAVREKDFRAWTHDQPVDRLAIFDSIWGKTTGRFRMLHAFAGGLASVLPRDAAHPWASEIPPAANGSTMIDSHRMTAESPLHAAQFHELQRLWRMQNGTVV